MKKTYRWLRKFIITVVGFAVFVLGLILIPLPGPGILVCIAGLFILSLEFAWAERHLDRAKTAQRKIIEKARTTNKPPPENTRAPKS